jgi:hypothetical protein
LDSLPDLTAGHHRAGEISIEEMTSIPSAMKGSTIVALRP